MCYLTQLHEAVKSTQAVVARTSNDSPGLGLHQARTACPHYTNAQVQSRLRLLQRIRRFLSTYSYRRDDPPYRSASGTHFFHPPEQWRPDPYASHEQLDQLPHTV